jgi:hypothetical protein
MRHSIVVSSISRCFLKLSRSALHLARYYFWNSLHYSALFQNFLSSFLTFLSSHMNLMRPIKTICARKMQTTKKVYPLELIFTLRLLVAGAFLVSAVLATIKVESSAPKITFSSALTLKPYGHLHFLNA